MQIDRKHIINVFAGGKHSLRDQIMVEQYLEDRRLDEEIKLAVKEQWEQFVPDRDVQPAMEHIYYKLYHEINAGKTSKLQKKRNLFLRISQIAAILIVGIVISAAIYWLNKDTRGMESHPVEFVSFQGFRNKFTLPDGTTGWLGYNSELKYHVDNNSRRIAELDGLAFFDVARNEKKPFVVKTPANIDIEVLGTRFNVSSYSDEQFCEIALDDGNVRLSLPDGSIDNMSPGDLVTYEARNSLLQKKRSGNIDDYLAWTEGKLVLNNVALADACVKLGRFYNAEFELQEGTNVSKNIRLVLEDETLEDAMNLIWMIFQINYSVEDRKPLDNERYTKKKVILINK